ncbi:MAG: tetratricopeptide repeat protein, partial [Alphaproteobacteria bacterium]
MNNPFPTFGSKHRLAAPLFATLALCFSCADAPPRLESFEGPSGVIAPRATAAGFAAEAPTDGAAGRLFAQAEAHFDQGRYREAAEAYQRSIDQIPTLAARLNLGIAQLSTSDLAAAARAFTKGLAQSRQQQDLPFVAAFLGNMGNVHANQHNLDKALAAFEEALAIYRRLD